MNIFLKNCFDSCVILIIILLYYTILSVFVSGHYIYDREGRYGGQYFCIPHFGMSAKTASKTVEMPSIMNYHNKVSFIIPYILIKYAMCSAFLFCLAYI